MSTACCRRLPGVMMTACGLSTGSTRTHPAFFFWRRTVPRRGVWSEVAAARQVSVSAVAINWAMSKGAVVIVGMKTPEQVRENLGALGWRISGAESDELERAARLAKTATQNIFQTD